MSYRPHLPQMDGGLFLTDGGIETTLIFHEGLDLPDFAAFHLLRDEAGTAAVRRYFEPYAKLARSHGAGLVLESPTWRASPRWGERLGYSRGELAALNRKAIALMAELRDEYATDAAPIVISGCIGPYDDGYDPSVALGTDAAERYHSVQVGTFADTDADMVTAVTVAYTDEAVGVTRAAVAAGMPVAISFTLETDGRLPSGQGIGDAIEETDAATGSAPAYYMINCAHPTHFESVLRDEPWRERIRGLRANASMKSRAELDAAEGVDEGDPDDLGARYAALAGKLPALNVLGGCCGTDHRHVTAVCERWPRV